MTSTTSIRLPTILSEIKRSPYISFEEYFQSYVISVQDTLIDEEMRFLSRNNFLSIRAIERLLNSEK